MTVTTACEVAANCIHANRLIISVGQCAGTGVLREQGYLRACQVRWCWSDALFMSPPAWTALSAVTGDPKYLQFSDEEFWATHATLYQPLPDVGGGLFIRDTSFAGQQVFWSRGNGWVFSGVQAILETLPQAHPSRSRRAAHNLLAPPASLHSFASCASGMSHAGHMCCVCLKNICAICGSKSSTLRSSKSL